MGIKLTSLLRDIALAAGIGGSALVVGMATDDAENTALPAGFQPVGNKVANIFDCAAQYKTGNPAFAACVAAKNPPKPPSMK
jgi:hypothetical protein